MEVRQELVDMQVGMDKMQTRLDWFFEILYEQGLIRIAVPMINRNAQG
jgi:hypothetical protein|tara:strand:- start:1094 stop:1237 length:144 start_codon:yes stop_codon:yes gene_type:complete